LAGIRVHSPSAFRIDLATQLLRWISAEEYIQASMACVSRFPTYFGRGLTFQTHLILTQFLFVSLHQLLLVRGWDVES
jgi:hypothetical protein